MTTDKKDIRALLFAMVRCALWGNELKVASLSRPVYAALMEEARRQTVDGLVMGVLIDKSVRLEKYDAIDVYSSLGTIRQQNAAVNKELHALCQLMRDNDIAFTVMKGQTVGAAYPNPADRISGDVDFYCPSGYVEKAVQMVEQQWNVTVEESGAEKHVAFVHNGIDFELHTFLNEFCSQSNQRFFDDATQRAATGKVEVDGMAVPVFEPVFNLAFTFIHLYMHLQELGVGLRQFCDVAVLCKQFPKTNQGYDKQTPSPQEQLAAILNELGYMRAFKAVGAILVDNLGLPEDDFPFVISKKDRKYAPYILDIVFKRGNFGKFGRKNKVRSGIMYYLEATWVKLSHYVRLFPLSPKENMAMLTSELPRRIIDTLRGGRG